MNKTSMVVTQGSDVVATYRSLFAGLYLWRRVGAWGLTFSRDLAEAQCLRDLEPAEAPKQADSSFPPGVLEGALFPRHVEFARGAKSPGARDDAWLTDDETVPPVPKIS